MIYLTETAKNAVGMLQKDHPEWAGLALRVYIEGKGCDGFYYGVTFDQPEAEDLQFSESGIKILIDPRTHLFCDESTVDWVDDERGKGFLVNNPQHRQYRGKFYKRQVWQQKLLPQNS